MKLSNSRILFDICKLTLQEISSTFERSWWAMPKLISIFASKLSIHFLLPLKISYKSFTEYFLKKIYQRDCIWACFWLKAYCAICHRFFFYFIRCGALWLSEIFTSQEIHYHTHVASPSLTQLWWVLPSDGLVPKVHHLLVWFQQCFHLMWIIYANFRLFG